MREVKSYVDVISEFTFCQDKDGGGVGISSKEESGSDEDLIKYQVMTQGLIAHDYIQPFFKKKVNGKWIRKSSLGSVVMTCLEIIDGELHLGEFHGGIVYKDEEPAIAVVKQALRAVLTENGAHVSGIGHVPAILLFPSQYELLEGDELVQVINSLNALMGLLRRYLLSQGMREKVKSFRRNADERYKQVMSAARQAWEKNRKNLLIRIDWGFKRKFPVERVMFKTEEEFTLQMRFVDTCRQKMLKILRRMFRGDLSMYFWKIECGEFKGIHIHWMIAVNAASHQDRINVAYRITKEWDDQIGDGQTYSFNLNAYGEEKYSGLGVIEYSEPNLWRTVGIYADYLTKVDYVLKLRMPKGMYSFGGTKIKGHGKQKPGPKRIKKMTELNVMQVRGPQGGRRKGDF